MPSPTPDRPRVLIHVRNTAYLEILYSAIEAAVVPPTMTAESLNSLTVWDRSRQHKRVHASPLPPCLIFSKSGLETAGILAGRSEVDGGRTIYVVERAFPVSSWQTDHSVGHSCKSPELLDELASALDLPFEVVGGYHSHPLGDFDIADIERERRFMPSVADVKSGPMFWGREINLVVSVTKAGDLKPAPVPQRGPIFQTRVGEFEIWFVAYGRPDEAAVLEIETRPHPQAAPFSNWQRRPPPQF